MIELRQYQVEAIDTGSQLLKKYGIVFLSMEVRTGKSFTSFGIIQECGFQSVLFITKKKAIKSIESDYEAIDKPFNLEVVNYEQVHKCTGLYDVIVIDESHSLSQYPAPSLRTKAIKKISANKPIIYLSGTVTPESYSGIYHQLWVSSYSPFRMYKNFYAWARDYVDIKTKRIGAGTEIKDYSGGKKDMILDVIMKYFITVTQEEAGFKQKPIETVYYVNMMHETITLFKTLAKKKVINVNNKEILCDSAVKLRSKLLQLCNGNIISTEGDYIVLDHSKAEFIKDRYKNEKIGIFYIFQSDYEIIKDVFGESNITASPEEFNSTNKTFVCQVKSGREGINLWTADRMVMYGIDYAAVSYFQAIHRHQYKDRERPLLIDWIFSNMRLEDKVLNAVQNKKDYTTTYFKDDLRGLL